MAQIEITPQMRRDPAVENVVFRCNNGQPLHDAVKAEGISLSHIQKSLAALGVRSDGGVLEYVSVEEQV